jgi:hypothetical protein
MRAEQAAAAEYERGLHLGCLLADKLSRPRGANVFAGWLCEQGT